jgi:hypothetical protein
MDIGFFESDLEIKECRLVGYDRVKDEAVVSCRGARPVRITRLRYADFDEGGDGIFTDDELSRFDKEVEPYRREYGPKS